MSEPNGGQFCYITFFTVRRLRAYLDLLCFATRTQRKLPLQRVFYIFTCQRALLPLKIGFTKALDKALFFFMFFQLPAFLSNDCTVICGTYNFSCPTHVIPNKTKGRLKKQLVSVNLRVVEALVRVHTY